MAKTFNDFIPQVRTINLMYNDLIALPSTFPEQVPNAQVIHLSGNKWHCNASLAWLPDFIRENEKLFLSKRHIVCYTPIEMRSKAIYQLDESELKDITGPPFIDVEPCPECKEPCDTDGTGGGTNGEPLIPEEERVDTAVEGGVEIEGASVDGGHGPEPANMEESGQADEVVAANLKVAKTDEAKTDEAVDEAPGSSLGESPSRIGKILGKVREGSSTSARESVHRGQSIARNDVTTEQPIKEEVKDDQPRDVSNQQPITGNAAEPEQDVINAPANENTNTGNVINAPANENIQNDAAHSDETTSAEQREILREKQKEKDQHVWAMMARMFKL